MTTNKSNKVNENIEQNINIQLQVVQILSLWDGFVRLSVAFTLFCCCKSHFPNTLLRFFLDRNVCKVQSQHAYPFATYVMSLQYHANCFLILKSLATVVLSMQNVKGKENLCNNTPNVNIKRATQTEDYMQKVNSFLLFC